MKKELCNIKQYLHYFNIRYCFIFSLIFIISFLHTSFVEFVKLNEGNFHYFIFHREPALVLAKVACLFALEMTLKASAKSQREKNKNAN